MKKLPYILALMVVLAACQKSEHAGHHEHHAATTGDSTNTILDNQIMAVHDAVMPKMDDLYKIKRDLQAKQAAAKTEAEKNLLQAKMNRIDSVGDLMMDWMHKYSYNPADTATSAESARAYLESEMERVKRVQEAIQTTVDTTKVN